MLSEDQIQRYSRQILLREVGGKGQRKLLENPVAVHGRGPALRVAVAYLAGGGSPLMGDLREVAFSAGAPVEAMNADVLASQGPAVVALVALPARGEAALPEVVVGHAAVAFRLATACPGCFDVTVAGLGADDSTGESVALGALAALVVQRIVLGRAEAGGVVTLRDRLETAELVACATHRGAEAGRR